MGRPKKNKKARNRSRSPDSGHKSSKSSSKSNSKRSRRRESSSSQSRSSSSDRCRSPSRSPERRRKKKTKRSRSKSRDRYSVQRGRSRSRSKEYRSRRSRSGSSSRGRRKRRSRSRSRSKLSSRSKETSLAASPLPARDGQSKDSPPTTREENPTATLHEKMQKALEAAATADAQLREQGILSSVTRNEILTQKEEKDRQKKLAKIEKDSFHSQPFQSSSNSSNTNNIQQPVYGISRDLNHDSAIFSSTNNTSDLENVARYLDRIQPNRNGKLASDLLSASKEEKEERWFQKLKAMRKQRLEGKPLAAQMKVDSG